MQITLSWQTIITAASVIGALGVIAAFVVKLVRWVDRQKKQDEDIKRLTKHHDDDMKSTNEEMTLLVYGVLACLKGLKEQGCNGPVTEAINKLEKHLNQKAHK
ncbi:MAG: hypothetical protein IKZ00_02965 [Bacteroidaceae bacterium]|nr:hypothetical protein [Bacteroidaceae bacterium]